MQAPPMSWIEIRAELPPLDDTSHFVEIYRDFGIENTMEEGHALVGCLPNVDGADERVSELAEALRSAGAREVIARGLPEVNWEEAWKQHFKPRKIGRNFVIRPTWEDYATGEGEIEIVLDPGQAFGTGDHATTRLCLELMEDAALRDAVVADVGCGSGILSVAAIKLGAAEVVAVDVEPTAVEVAKENAALNGVQFLALTGDGIAPLLTASEGGREGFDVVLSNIISAILIRLARDVSDALVPGGRWIVSGVIPQNWPDVLAAAERAGFEIRERREEDGWVAALFHRP
jgi:ribosomal protein L11 methyltransferase